MTRATRPARAAAASASSGGARKTSESAAATWGSDCAKGTSTIGTVGSPPPTARLVAYWLQDTVKQSIAATASVGATAGTVTWTSRRAGRTERRSERPAERVREPLLDPLGRDRLDPAQAELLGQQRRGPPRVRKRAQREAGERHGDHDRDGQREGQATGGSEGALSHPGSSPPGPRAPPGRATRPPRAAARPRPGPGRPARGSWSRRARKSTASVGAPALLAAGPRRPRSRTRPRSASRR